MSDRNPRFLDEATGQGKPDFLSFLCRFGTPSDIHSAIRDMWPSWLDTVHLLICGDTAAIVHLTMVFLKNESS
jgi:hypothetical protein